MQKFLSYFGLVLALAIAMWAYQPALDAPFVFDDEQNIVDSPAIRWTELSWENVSSVIDASRLQSRPVANLSFALDYWRNGLEPRGYHLTNVLIHLAVGIALLYLCVLYARVTAAQNAMQGSFRQDIVLALVPISIFLLHPLNTQAVTYVVQRMTTLAALFVILAFSCYLLVRHRVTLKSRWWYLAALLFWSLAIGSKEIGVLLLPVILVYEVCFFRAEWRLRIENLIGGSWTRKWTVVAWLTGGTAIALLALVIIASTDLVGFTTNFDNRDFNGTERLMTQARVQLFHLSQFVWPEPGRLNLDHDIVVSRGVLQPLTTLPAIIACIGLLAGAIYLAGRQPRYGFPLVAYFVFHAIEAGPVNLEILFEHRMYLPSTMLIIVGVTFLLDSGRNSRVALIAVSGLAIVTFSTWTHQRNQIWADPLRFSADMAEKSPKKARVQHNWALALLEAKRPVDALPVIRRAIELDPRESRLNRLLGRVLLDLDRPEEAVDAYRTAVRLDPVNVRAAIGLGEALEAIDVDAALQHYLAAGFQFGRSEAVWEAIPLLTRAVELRGNDPAARNALGSAYMMAGLRQQAYEQFLKAVEAGPDLVESWYNLGLAADALGRVDEAIVAYQSFLEHASVDLQPQIKRARARVEALSASGNR